MPTAADLQAFADAKIALDKKASGVSKGSPSLIPDEPIPSKNVHRAVGSQLPLYGFKSWGDLFNSRQKLAIAVLQEGARKVHSRLLRNDDEQFAQAIFLLLAFAVDKQADYSSSLCRWVSKGEFIAGTLAGEKKLPMMADFAEANPIGCGSGNWENHIDWIVRFIEREARVFSHPGTVGQSSADDRALPSDAAAAMITDPPYYDSVPYADLSDYFYVWLKRTLYGLECVSANSLTPKDREMTVNHPDNQDEKTRYESLLTSAFSIGRDVTAPNGVGVIVFAHKSTSGWETLLEAIVRSGWIVTASWPIDTERTARLNALGTASLGSSVHIVCRPRETSHGSVLTDEVGDWRDVLQGLPGRIHEWMPRLAEEGVVGADAIFACLGPALEIFSQYSRVEKASGEPVSLKEYLEHVWAAVAKEALAMIFAGVDATGFEEDARLTAMWLWTLSTGSSNGSGTDDVVETASNDDEEVSADGKGKIAGFVLEYDAARKIAQGLGAHLEALSSLVEVKGSSARLLPVAERTRALFGKTETLAEATRRRKKSAQLTFDFMADIEEVEESGGWGETGAPEKGATVLDRVHQAMILFGAGRAEALRRFLVDDGAGHDDRLWRLAQALSALYPTGTDERRWVEGVLARKKGLGL